MDNIRLRQWYGIGLFKVTDCARSWSVRAHGKTAGADAARTGPGLSVATDIGAAICRLDRGFTASIARTQKPRFDEG
jgi:hypothetical protein